MIEKERLRTVYLFTVIAACCFLVFGCQKPENVDCFDLSTQIKEDPIICTDGNEIQVCMSEDSESCGYYVNSTYLPCRTCTCDVVTRVAVAMCSGISPSVDSSFPDQGIDDSF